MPSSHVNLEFQHVKCPVPFGTHHTKMMLLQYREGLRVVVHTANLIPMDWANRTQGIWMSPIFPRIKGDARMVDTDSVTAFKKDLLKYLSSYRLQCLDPWLQEINSHDFSDARVYLIASVPGRHEGSTARKEFGHMRLGNILKDYSAAAVTQEWPLIGQFSSVGSLGASPTTWLESEWAKSLAGFQLGNPKVQLIFPTVDDVRNSLDGYISGGSLPYSFKTHMKQQWFTSFLHRWTSLRRKRSRASPHIKTYTRLSPDRRRAAWFLLTSANLSKAAWGELQKQGNQLFIRSYELGVLFLPQLFKSEIHEYVWQKMYAILQTGEDWFEVTEGGDGGEEFPVPWDLQPIPYGRDDRPWLWDKQYSTQDPFGNKWPLPHV
ncbi:unnamed protein product [Darwinula stevensoni]|uniref:Tyrosyl-DNA phosphodiesterase 1 n=1 Tax=Darwinula stevensoni TaxID=69355 RepID=A0A7R9FQM2_9CRUS|nr:unnamed protein product [Darwinula stevensoni]CAG0899423.1 unnamed protein product [Darwinula stevensoni]